MRHTHRADALTTASSRVPTLARLGCSALCALRGGCAHRQTAAAHRASSRAREPVEDLLEGPHLRTRLRAPNERAMATMASANHIIGARPEEELAPTPTLQPRSPSAT